MKSLPNASSLCGLLLMVGGPVGLAFTGSLFSSSSRLPFSPPAVP